jgi:hypothetical protein
MASASKRWPLIKWILAFLPPLESTRSSGAVWWLRCSAAGREREADPTPDGEAGEWFPDVFFQSGMGSEAKPPRGRDGSALIASPGRRGVKNHRLRVSIREQSHAHIPCLWAENYRVNELEIILLGIV